MASVMKWKLRRTAKVNLILPGGYKVPKGSVVIRYKFVKDGTESVEYDPMFQLIRPNDLYVRSEKRVKWSPKTEAVAQP
ncbi:predicted protein [Plenodomus lingam JN3]|uniref:Predicted protein n=1 Tax=Leptosphaeria maculans (strain JN3 / isolate v23.1.3 / race Av1-4-5-6-7-8) TaxID=985895 RepID=E4ZJH9_LEPMJ|nr:predicted protein [Plenodomus lingam JN3]CBX91770.1 predicted protein [Plenodomus lingam JN3]